MSKGKAHDHIPAVLVEFKGPRDVFMRNQPSVIRPSAANGRTYPGFLKPGLREVNVSFVQVKHVCERDILAHRNIKVAGFQTDGALVFIEPPQEIPPDCIGSDEALERGYTIEIDNVGRIE